MRLNLLISFFIIKRKLFLHFSMQTNRNRRKKRYLRIGLLEFHLVLKYFIYGNNECLNFISLYCVDISHIWKIDSPFPFFSSEILFLSVRQIKIFKQQAKIVGKSILQKKTKVACFNSACFLLLTHSYNNYTNLICLFPISFWQIEISFIH